MRFIIQFSATGSVVWTAFIGGEGAGYGTDVVVNPQGLVYMVGYNYPDQSYAGWDGYLTQIDPFSWIYLPMLRK